MCVIKAACLSAAPKMQIVEQSVTQRNMPNWDESAKFNRTVLTEIRAKGNIACGRREIIAIKLLQ